MLLSLFYLDIVQQCTLLPTARVTQADIF